MAAGATYEPIATQTLAATAASITFSSIAASWTDLKLVLVCQGSTASLDLWVRVNGDAGANYSMTSVYGNGTAAASFRSSAASRITLNQITGIPPVSPNWALANIDIFSYAGSTYKTLLANVSADKNGSGSSELTVGLWRSTAAITSVAVLPSSSTFAIGTTATLYGIKAA